MKRLPEFVPSDSLFRDSIYSSKCKYYLLAYKAKQRLEVCRVSFVLYPMPHAPCPMRLGGREEDDYTRLFKELQVFRSAFEF
jgi:hypothetical protein